MKRRFTLLFYLILFSAEAFSQGTLSGDLQTNLNIFQRDSSIGAFNTPQYDNYFTGLETWLNVNYNILGFTTGVRLDIYHNSNLIDPNKAYSGAGIGYFYLQKSIGDLTITGGYFYEQFGSGIVYRAYEERGLGIDYATFGLNLRYRINDRWTLKGIAGQEKNLFSRYNPVIKGIDGEGEIDFSNHIKLYPGVSFLNRTMDQQSIDFVVNTINSYDSSDRFIPKYNAYAFSGYFTLNINDFSWYAEVAAKTHEAILDAGNMLTDKSGNVEYSSISFSRKGIGLTGQFKRTKNYVLRTSPNEIQNNGVLNFIPPMSRQNSLRLPARYSPQTQYLGELAFQLDATVTPRKGYLFELNYSDIRGLDGKNFWKELILQLDNSHPEKIEYVAGIQYVFYNWQIYRSEPKPNLNAICPFIEFTYKIDQKRSIRTELQYQNTRQDFGSWLYALLEYNIASKWSISASDMYNIDPNREETNQKNHYYNFFASYTRNANRFSLSYVRQVAGINCTGGVCRYEPAFSGIKFALTSSF
ncbi:MAG: hypothetical protein H0W62_01370 [Chitinophagales bacterium]|nr:hypothetical protein [Chitinophagales bacterium]